MKHAMKAVQPMEMKRRADHAGRRFVGCQRGIAAVEFALILPILILLLLGASELTRALTFDRKVTQAAATVGDLVAQSDEITSTDMNDIFTAGNTILQPYPPTGLGLRISSVTFNDTGTPKVSWSCAEGTSKWAKNVAPPIPIPAALKLPNTSIIVAVSSLSYQPTFTTIISGAIQLGETYFMRPRLVDQIDDPNC